MRTAVLLGIPILVAATSTTALADEHEHEDIIVGWTNGGTPGGPATLAAEFAHWDEEHVLPPVSGPLFGWQGDAPGFGHLEADEPDENFYTLADGVNVLFEVVALDPGLKVWTPGFGDILEVGETYSLGGDHLHGHMEWHIDSTVPGVDPETSTYGVTFRLLDAGTTGYGASADYTLTFVPEPTALGLLGVALAIVRRR